MQIVVSLVKLGIPKTLFMADWREQRTYEKEHRRVSDIVDRSREDNRCSSPLPEKHSKKLTDIPASLYAVSNSRGENKENYCPGSKWCHMCKRKFYKEAGMTDVNKRRTVNLISAFPFIIKEWTMSSVRPSNSGCTRIVGRARR